jgi:hypothetical protein
MLALKMNNVDVINVLCDHGADIKHKSFDGDTSPIEYAVSLRNTKILRILIQAIKKQKLYHWENNKANILKSIKNLPDFTLDLKLNFDSNLFSIFSTLTPSDNYKVTLF